MLNFLMGFGLNIMAYVCIWWYGKIGGTSNTLQEAFLSIFQPKAFLLLLVGNMFFATALFLYFKQTGFAIPIAISVGALTSFFLGIFIMQNPVSYYHVIGIVLTIAGIILMFR